MPNSGHVWVPTEERAAIELDWGEFTERFPDITFDAWRIRKQNLLRQMKKEGRMDTVVNEDDLVQVPQTADNFVGFNIGFWDLETTFSTQPRVLYGAVADAWGNVTEWRREDHPGKDAIDDGPLVEAIADGMSNFDIVVGWNSKLFDVPVLNGRLLYHGKRPYQPNMHVDLMYYASGSSARIGRRSLESVSTFFGSPHRKTPLNVRTWDLAVSGDQDAYNLIAEHCIADVLVLRDVFASLKHMIRNVHR